MPDSAGWIFNFQSPGTDPADLVLQAGGKGANLVRLAQAGLPVPEGFILTTAAYRDFVSCQWPGGKNFIRLAAGRVH